MIKHFILSKDNMVDVCDMLHDTDSSTIHGIARGYIERVLEREGLMIPRFVDGKRTKQVLGYVKLGDVIVCLNDGSFLGMTKLQFDSIFPNIEI